MKRSNEKVCRDRADMAAIINRMGHGDHFRPVDLGKDRNVAASFLKTCEKYGFVRRESRGRWIVLLRVKPSRHFYFPVNGTGLAAAADSLPNVTLEQIGEAIFHKFLRYKKELKELREDNKQLREENAQLKEHCRKRNQERIDLSQL